MSAQDNWLANVKALVDAHTPRGAKSPRLGYRAVATISGLEEEYIYQLYKGHKTTVGSDAARSIARGFADGRDLSWIDRPPEANAQLAVSKPLSERATSLGRRLDGLSERRRATAYALMDLTLRTLEAEDAEDKDK